MRVTLGNTLGSQAEAHPCVLPAQLDDTAGRRTRHARSAQLGSTTRHLIRPHALHA